MVKESPTVCQVLVRQCQQIERTFAVFLYSALSFYTPLFSLGYTCGLRQTSRFGSLLLAPFVLLH